MKALVAMSGGVDSSVAAYLALKKGYDVSGGMMKLFPDTGRAWCQNGASCLKTEADDAKRVADMLGIPFHLFELYDEFEENVIKAFVNEYICGGTPNPCIECNKHLKFGLMLELMETIGCEKLITGHYARIKKDSSGRYMLQKAVDESKDQSYVLYSLTSEKLERLEFPVGGMTKSEIRTIADENSFVNSNKPDSQDICFIPDGDYSGFIKRYTGKEFETGSFVDQNGNVLGTHKGIINYTVGQRKGLGLALPAPMYVGEKRLCDNTVVLVYDKDLYKEKITVGDVSWNIPKVTQNIYANVKIRYKQKETPSEISVIDENTVSITFLSPQRAPAKGQSAVFYVDDTVIGGGKIL